VQIVSNRTYLACRGGGLRVFDTTQPTNVIYLGGTYTPGWACSDLQVEWPLAYVADGGAGLEIFNVSNPAAITGLSTNDTPGFAYGLQVAGWRAYVADGYRGIQVFDVTQPTNVVGLGSYLSREAWKVRVIGNLAYVANGPDGLLVLDVSNPASIAPVGSFATGGYVRDVKVVNSRVYLADGEWGLTVLEAPPRFASPQLINGTFQAAVNNLTGQGTLVIESSTDLVQWIPLQTNTISGLGYPFSTSWDTNAPAGFFRARVR
jgi:hypothetical protein